MNPTKLETDSIIGKPKQAIPPPPLPRFWARKTTADSITNREIAKFWRQKRIEEEDHLLAAIKAAARIRARNLRKTVKCFEESLSNEDNNAKEKITAPTNNGKGDKKNNEIRVGIKDWWTKSKYAYLNQPAVESMGDPSEEHPLIFQFF
ncbi:uncharacterized protein LOC111293297 [Durio zibethinus]|uniref:Uncharacterized protein LOC111293297 n=1 Tax=Durio zibethinus TaxID=66656 RepID=A0A6P5YNE8_DURZI|nr:uncharacterized protein LOC111293297 [Durio zibethinus]